MPTQTRKQHWEGVYSTKAADAVSWHQDIPRLSLELIRDALPPAGGRIVDVGGGASTLVDNLLALAPARLAVLDISATALDKARARLGDRAAGVEWIVADVAAAPDLGAFDVWHDRAVFHFLTDPDDRRRYVELAERTIPAGGRAVVAAFADDGPARCSDLDVRRYNAATMSAELGPGFALVREAAERHVTPWGAGQSFFYGVFERR
ncbi:MAG: hypothetical protein BGO49_30820 [Planctomycetales bacterium 71-10]|nr:MAG: hypothetical protein BGO49_30820 [Planctomycetales bacterium 71-10]